MEALKIGGVLPADSRRRNGYRSIELSSRKLRLSGDELEFERARETSAEIGGSRVGKAEMLEKPRIVRKQSWWEITTGERLS